MVRVGRVLRQALAIVAWLCSASAANASTATTEITDMWWNPAEAGWGVNIVLQNDVAFMTFFVYDANQNPVWYTSTVRHQGNFVWTGNLYATKGPWFGGPFPTSAVLIRPVGTVQFAVSAIDQATLTYSIDGVSVSKSLQRQTWTIENYSGSYVGGYSIRFSNCIPPYSNGIGEIVGILSINHVGSNIAISLQADVGSCNLSGTYAQTGKLGHAQGTYSCSDGLHGNFLATEMTPTISGMTARVTGQNQYCQWSGYFGGIARAN